ncbi:sulfatase [Halalkalicoccus tibetensis]|uniref:Sulfatase n=1 Tax=Halalkalicoccus tibetensis TaxID=175632 RepID=A0ABD5V2T8_9EURY
MDGPNVLFIVMDTSRANIALNEEVMPTVASIADEGATFENAFTTAPWSLPSHASIFTGQYSSHHNTHAGSTQFNPDVSPLAEVFAQENYETRAISNNIWISPEFGFDRGFQSFQKGWQLVDGGADIGQISKEQDTRADQVRAIADELLRIDAPKTIINSLFALFVRKRYDSGAWLTNKRLFRWLQSRDNSQSFFAFLNYLEPHLPYDPPENAIKQINGSEADTERMRSVPQDAWDHFAGDLELTDRDFDDLKTLYAAELRYLDSRIESVYEKLDEVGILDDTILVITGDHGENIGDHDLMDHQYSLHDTLLHVPLIIRYPEAFDPGSEYEQSVELRDLYPTLLDLCNIETSLDATQSDRNIATEEGSGYTLGEYLTPQPAMETLEDRFGNLSERVRAHDRSLASIRTQDWKLIIGSDGSELLYDLQTDPDERHDVREDHEDVVTELRDQMPEPIKNVEEKSESEDRNVGSRTEQRLEDLGYL